MSCWSYHRVEVVGGRRLSLGSLDHGAVCGAFEYARLASRLV